MLLLHLADPGQTCRQLVGATAPGGQLVIHDADFTAVALQDATELETAGIAVMFDTMRAAGDHLALGPQLETLLGHAGARIDHVESPPATGRAGYTAALITAITLERFRNRSPSTPSEGLAAAIAALRDRNGRSPDPHGGSRAATHPAHSSCTSRRRSTTSRR